MASVKKYLPLVIAALVATTVSARAQKTSASAATEKARPAYSEPGVSPDGKEIAFVSGGNIWTVPAAGGEARLLVSDMATDSRPLYSPDGTKLAYVSARDGSGNVYVLTFATGEVKRLTYDDTLDRVDGWSRDGKWVYFSSANHDISYMNDVYRVSVEGGTPMAVAADRYAKTVASSADGADARTVIVQPVTTSEEKELLYHQWVERNRAYVEKISNGKLGYVHIPDMGESSLQNFYLDLDTQNRSREGVVIDIRSNTGGFVNAYALDVLSRRPYLSMTPRDFPTAPARSELGQRSLELPTILVTNQHSLSDAEDFTEGYRSMKLGKVVGEPTAGWIIYTSGTQLIDGSFLRLPFIRITAADGTPMELHPRPVDFLVTRPMGESYTEHDVQLDTAVRELLKEIPNSTRPQM